MFYIQLIGLLAFCVLVLSFYRKTPTQILTYQITSSFAYAVHYFLLGGISGAFNSLINLIRNICIMKSKKMKLIIVAFVVLYLAIGFVFYEGFYSFIPTIGNIIYLILMSMKNKKKLLLGGIFSSIGWLTYSIFVSSYVCMITESILIISNTIQLLKKAYN